MSFELFLLYFVSFFSIIATVGFGTFVNKFKLLNLGNSLGYIGFQGILLLSIYSVLSSFFYSHNLFHNTFLVFFGILLFFFLYIRKFKSIFKKIFLIHVLLFIGLLIFKTHDDFNYYHFEYSYFLTQEKKFFGIGNFDLGFRTPSTIFFLNSLFYLPKISYFSFHIPAFLIVIFVNLYLIEKLKFFYEKNDHNILNLFLLSSILFVNIFFYRIAEHGTDRSAQILVLVLFYEIIFFINYKFKNKEQFYNSKTVSKIIVLITLVIGFKAFFILYFFLSIIIFYKLYEILKLKKTILFLYKNIFVYILCLKLILLAFVNYYDSGCLLYPIHFTCFDKNIWAIPIAEVKNLNQWYELWSKGGASPNFRVTNPAEYIQGINWVHNWMQIYFFNKVSDFVLSLTVLIVLIIFLFRNFIKYDISKFNKFNLIFLFIILLLLLEWFFQHPSLRYGGYCLIAVIFFIIPYLLFSLKKKKSNKKKIVLVLIFISLTFYNVRNISSIHKEYKQYNYNPFKNAFYKIEENNFKNYKLFKCSVEKNFTCSNKNIGISYDKNNKIFYKKNN